MQQPGGAAGCAKPAAAAAAPESAAAGGGGDGSGSSTRALTTTHAPPPGQQRQTAAAAPPCHKPPLAPGSHQHRAGMLLQGGGAGRGPDAAWPVGGAPPCAKQQSPLRGSLQAWHPGPATPISTAMGSISWLRSLTTQDQACGSKSAGLARFVEAAGGEAARAALEQRAQDAGAAVFLSPPGGGSSSSSSSGSAGGGLGGARGLLGLQQGLAQAHKQQGLALYWHMLEAMLRAEEARAGLSAAGALLTRWRFHQCLLACAFECVAAAPTTAFPNTVPITTRGCCGLSFPAIPGRLGLAPFELIKFIGPFVRAEPSLPRELQRHMLSVEERMLESLGWAAGSSLYSLLGAAVNPQQQQQVTASGQAGADAATQAQQQAVAQQQLRASDQQQQQQQLVQEAAVAAQQVQPEPSRKRPALSETDDLASAAASSKRQRGAEPAAAAGAAAQQVRTKPLPTALGWPPSNSSSSGSSAQQRAAAAGASDPAAAAVLHEFCRKVLKLAAFRLVAVSEGLDFSPMARDEVLAQVHTLLSELLHGHTSLFYGRHLDTLLLCCLYGCCKANKLDQVTFAAIVERYKVQPHCRQQEVLRAVPLEQDGSLVTLSTTDIIKWYNRVFVPAMKLVMSTPQQQQQQQQQAEATVSGSPATATAAAAAAASGQPFKVSPVQLALQLSGAAPSPLQGNGSTAATSPASSGGSRTHRALALPPAPQAPAGCSSHSLAGGQGLGLAAGLAQGAAQQWLGEPVAAGLWSPDLPPAPQAAGAAAAVGCSAAGDLTTLLQGLPASQPAKGLGITPPLGLDSRWLGVTCADDGVTRL